MRLRVGARTSAGRHRADNQDYLLYRTVRAEPDAERDCSLFLAADGVGGAAGGAVASRLAAEATARSFPRDGGENPAASLVSAIQAAGPVIVEAARGPGLEHMATTMVAAVVRGGACWLANVGDSRGYIFRDGSILAVTLDHSYVAEEVRAGRLSEEVAAGHPYRHVITRSLNGSGEPVEVDTFGPITLQKGDRIVLCTDGLTETVPDEEIPRVMAGLDAEEAAQSLVDEANRRGGPDNVSVIVVIAVE
jgi:serine/threonine protein phosphatase PrpC